MPGSVQLRTQLAWWLVPDSESDSSAPNTGDSTTAVSEDFIDAVEARQAEEAAAAQAAASSSSRPRNRRIDFTAEADALVK